MSITVNETKPTATERITPLIEPLFMLLRFHGANEIAPILSVFINALATVKVVPACSVRVNTEDHKFGFFYAYLDWADGTKGEIRYESTAL